MSTKIWQADDCIETIRSKNKNVLSVLGYSALAYEFPERVDQLSVQFLRQLDPNAWIVNAGGSDVGIGSIYLMASRMGFQTIGVVSALALQEKTRFSPDVDDLYLVEDDCWGGYHEGTSSLSNTSKVILEVSNRILAIGGNQIAQDELTEALKRKIEITFFPAEMNHSKAKQSGIPADEWSGMASKLFADGLAG